MDKKTIEILQGMILEEKNKLKYLRFCIAKPNPLATKHYYLNEIKICEGKIEVLSKLLDCQ